jgi:hypothetical protein
MNTLPMQELMKGLVRKQNNFVVNNFAGFRLEKRDEGRKEEWVSGRQGDGERWKVNQWADV